MRAGDLDRRIIIRVATSGKNRLGEKTAGVWSDFATIWAKYAPISDGERLRAAAVEQKTDARFTVRWSAQMALVNGTYRLGFDGSDWQITGTKEIGRRRWLEITAWRMVQSGV